MYIGILIRRCWVCFAGSTSPLTIVAKGGYPRFMNDDRGDGLNTETVGDMGKESLVALVQAY
jgi:hypothetical protein